VVFQDLRAHFVQRSLDSLNLADDVNTIRSIFHHPFYAPDVALDVPQPAEYLCLFFHR
jgi:hypothetical protein